MSITERIRLGVSRSVLNEYWFNPKYQNRKSASPTKRRIGCKRTRSYPVHGITGDRTSDTEIGYRSPEHDAKTRQKADCSKPVDPRLAPKVMRRRETKNADNRNAKPCDHTTQSGSVVAGVRSPFHKPFSGITVERQPQKKVSEVWAEVNYRIKSCWGKLPILNIPTVIAIGSPSLRRSPHQPRCLVCLVPE